MKIKIVLLAIMSLIVLSCTDDNTTNPTKSDINGSWEGIVIDGLDTASFSCIITENNGKISGTGSLFAFHKVVNGSTVTTESAENSGTVNGTFSNSALKVHFQSDETDRFEGTLSNDKLSISGKIFTVFVLSSHNAEYQLVLNKK